MRTVPQNEVARLLLVEDNPGDVRLIEEALEECHTTIKLQVVSDGEEALNYLARRDDYADVRMPDLVLLDLNLPKVNGLTILERLQDDAALSRIPVIVLTSSGAEEDILRSYELHSNAYLTKPTDLDGFVDLTQTIEAFWLRLVQRPPARR